MVVEGITLIAGVTYAPLHCIMPILYIYISGDI